MEYQIKDIDLSDRTPECNTPEEIVTCIMSICNKLFPNLQPEIKGFEKTGMNNYQVAYALSKAMYSQAFDEANKATEAECQRIGLVTDTDEALDRWSEIDSKYDGEFAVGHFMFLKWQAEKMMVLNAFQRFEADPKIKRILAKNNADFLKVKANWEKPSIRSKIVDLSFKLRT